MTEYKDAVEEQRLILQAEKWAKELKSIHIHSLSSMWYDDRPEDTADGKMVTDTEYNDNRIVREQNGKIIHTWGEEKSDKELLQSFLTNTA